jgi:predicted transcriptional regulator
MNTVPGMPIPKKEVKRRLRRLGISQNELARRIGRPPGVVSRVINRKFASRPVWSQIQRFFDEHSSLSQQQAS